jgi:hypothetical protein
MAIKKIGQIEYNDIQCIRIQVGGSEDEDGVYIDIRTFWRVNAMDQWKPSRRGVRIHNIDRFKEIIKAAIEKTDQIRFE